MTDKCIRQCSHCKDTYTKSAAGFCMICIDRFCVNCDDDAECPVLIKQRNEEYAKIWSKRIAIAPCQINPFTLM